MSGRYPYQYDISSGGGVGVGFGGGVGGPHDPYRVSSPYQSSEGTQKASGGRSDGSGWGSQEEVENDEESYRRSGGGESVRNTPWGGAAAGSSGGWGGGIGGGRGGGSVISPHSHRSPRSYFPPPMASPPRGAYGGGPPFPLDASAVLRGSIGMGGGGAEIINNTVVQDDNDDDDDDDDGAAALDQLNDGFYEIASHLMSRHHETRCLRPNPRPTEWIVMDVLPTQAQRDAFRDALRSRFAELPTFPEAGELATAALVRAVEREFGTAIRSLATRRLSGGAAAAAAAAANAAAAAAQAAAAANAASDPDRIAPFRAWGTDGASVAALSEYGTAASPSYRKLSSANDALPTSPASVSSPAARGFGTMYRRMSDPIGMADVEPHAHPYPYKSLSNADRSQQHWNHPRSRAHVGGDIADSGMRDYPRRTSGGRERERDRNYEHEHERAYTLPNPHPHDRLSEASPDDRRREAAINYGGGGGKGKGKGNGEGGSDDDDDVIYELQPEPSYRSAMTPTGTTTTPAMATAVSRTFTQDTSVDRPPPPSSAVMYPAHHNHNHNQHQHQHQHQHEHQQQRQNQYEEEAPSAPTRRQAGSSSGSGRSRAEDAQRHQSATTTTTTTLTAPMRQIENVVDETQAKMKQMLLDEMEHASQVLQSTTNEEVREQYLRHMRDLRARWERLKQAPTQPQPPFSIPPPVQSSRFNGMGGGGGGSGGKGSGGVWNGGISGGGMGGDYYAPSDGSHSVVASSAQRSVSAQQQQQQQRGFPLDLADDDRSVRSSSLRSGAWSAAAGGGGGGGGLVGLIGAGAGGVGGGDIADDKSTTSVPACKPMGKLYVDVVAPENLPANYTFEARYGDQIFIATVPPGGVVRGQLFKTEVIDIDETLEHETVRARMLMDMGVPRKKWRDELFDCCVYGIGHPSFVNSVLFPHVALSQIMARMRLTAHGEKVKTLQSRLKVINLVWLTIALLVMHGFYAYFTIRALQDIRLYMYSCIPLLVMDVGLIGLTLYMTARTRKAVRTEYDIPGRRCRGYEDVCLSIWCTSCVLSQMGRHTADYETYRANFCTDTGLPNHIEVKLPSDPNYELLQ